MSKRIQITMLGVSGSGKTSFMTAMYGMMSTGDCLQGFLLSSENVSQHQRLAKNWEELLDDDSREWPESTAGETATYDFNLTHGTKPVIGFDWLDYRGGAIKDPNVNAPDLVQLQERLSSSSSIFICVSGERLATAVKPADFTKTGVSNINNLLVNTFNNVKVNNPPALVIVITKYDKCSHRSKAEITAEIKKLFQPWFAENSSWLVLVCPVTLGSSLSRDEKSGEIDPKGIHLPIIFSLVADLARQNRDFYDEKLCHVGQLDRLQNGLVSRWLKGRQISTEAHQVAYLENSIQKINTDLQNLFSVLAADENVTLHHKGREAKFSEIFYAQ